MKILMVCLGNICRSPLAHGILKHLSVAENLNWQIESAGTGNWHVGQAPDLRSIAIAKQYGVDISTQRARHFTPSLFDDYDQIFVMDKQNLKDVLSLARHDADRTKVTLFLPDAEVPDPYFDDMLFDPVYSMIADRCMELLKVKKKQ